MKNVKGCSGSFAPVAWNYSSHQHPNLDGCVTSNHLADSRAFVVVSLTAPHMPEVMGTNRP